MFFKYEQVLLQADYSIRQAKQEEKRLIFFIIDLSKILNRLLEEIPFLDRFYLRRDLHTTLSLLCVGGGFCGPANDDNFILAIKTKKSHSKAVMIHQIINILKKQWYEGREIPDFKVLSRIWPEDGQTSEDLLADFFSTTE